MNRVTMTFFIPILLLMSSAGQSDDMPTEKTRMVQSKDVLALTIANNRSLQIALLSEERAAQSVRTASAQYPYVFSADTGYTHSSSPIGDSRYQRRDSVSAGAGLSKTYAAGTEADLSVDGEWYDTRTPSGVANERDAENSGLGFGARFTVTQPLLRGFGKRVVLAPLRQAKKEKHLTEKQVNASASTVAKSVLVDYWDLWLAAKSVEINLQSQRVAEQQLAETADRVDMGEAAPVDKLSFQTRLASLKETVLESEAKVRQMQVQLVASAGIIEKNQLLAPDPAEPLPIYETPPKLNSLIKQSLTESPDIQEAFAALAVAKERAKVAGESTRQRLDLAGWIEARTASDDGLAPVATDLGEGGAYSGYIGLLYELPLDNQQKAGEQAKARIDVETAERTLQLAEERIRADVTVGHHNLITALQRVTMTEETLDLATKQVEAERERYRLGATIFTSIREAEETLRSAELRLESARIDVVKAQIELEHLSGTLLKQINIR